MTLPEGMRFGAREVDAWLRRPTTASAGCGERSRYGASRAAHGRFRRTGAGLSRQSRAREPRHLRHHLLRALLVGFVIELVILPKTRDPRFITIRRGGTHGPTGSRWRSRRRRRPPPASKGHVRNKDSPAFGQPSRTSSHTSAREAAGLAGHQAGHSPVPPGQGANARPPAAPRSTRRADRRGTRRPARHPARRATPVGKHA
jgi:hypothetical protein